MLKFPKKIMALFLSLLLLIPGAAVTAFAEYDTGNGNVVQSGDGWKLYENGLLYVSDADRITLNKLDDFDLITKLYIGDNINDLEFDHEEFSEPVEFYELSNLESIEVSESNPNYTSIDGVLYNKDITEIIAYPSGKPDETYKIPDGVESVSITDFYLSQIKNLYIPDSLVKIEDLYDITGEDYHYDFFYMQRKSSSLENIFVSENNTKFSSIDGVLCNKEKTTIWYYPYNHNVSSYTIPSEIRSITSFTFWETGITDTIIIPGSVEEINSNAFYYNYTINTVIFEDGPRNLNIAMAAFNNCRNIENIQLDSSRIYSINSIAFYNSKFMRTESNYENGVLYLNDILLFIDNSKMPIDYTVKDGTKCIANDAFIVHSNSDKFVDFFKDYNYPIKTYYEDDSDTTESDNTPSWSAVNVTIPDSVDNIGTMSIFNYINIPENMFRVGSNLLNYIGGDKELVLGDGTKTGTEFYETAKNYYYNFDASSPSSIRESIDKGYDWLSFDVDNWILAPKMMSYYKGILSLIYRVKDGAIGFADFDTLTYMYSHSYDYSAFLKSILLPESFNHLSNQTFISAYFYYYIHEDFNDDICITFANKDCYIYDSSTTISPKFTICGYKGSTAEAYAIKYDRTFVDISECQHEKTCPNFTIEPTCGKDGYSGDVYCQYCGEYIKEGEVLPATGEHKFSSPETVKWPTCTEPGEKKVTCSTCGYSETRETEPYGHDFIIKISSFDGTCTEDGYVIKKCIMCSETQTEITSIATGHADDNNDGYCDKCDKKITPDCSCICHKDNAFSRFFYKLFRILWKIFRTNKSCDCGATHY